MTFFNFNPDYEDLLMPEIEISSPELLKKKSMLDIFPEMIECGIRLKPEFVQHSGMVVHNSGEGLDLYENMRAVKKLDFEFIADAIFCQNQGVTLRMKPEQLRIQCPLISWEYKIIPEDGLNIEGDEPFHFGGLLESDLLSLMQKELYINDSGAMDDFKTHHSVEERIGLGEIILPVELTLYEYHPDQIFLEKNLDTFKKFAKKEYVSYACGYFQHEKNIKKDQDQLIWVQFKPKPE